MRERERERERAWFHPHSYNVTCVKRKSMCVSCECEFIWVLLLTGRIISQEIVTRELSCVEIPVTALSWVTLITLLHCSSLTSPHTGFMLPGELQCHQFIATASFLLLLSENGRQLLLYCYVWECMYVGKQPWKK